MFFKDSTIHVMATLYCDLKIKLGFIVFYEKFKKNFFAQVIFKLKKFHDPDVIVGYA